MAPRFHNRADAGQALATMLMRYANRPDVLVLALPRGGVPVAYEVAQALKAPLDVMLVRKLGMPGFDELAVGAIASGAVVIRNHALPNPLGLLDCLVAWLATRERPRLEQREHAYRGSAPRPNLRGKTVILVDDGLATGTTMRAAIAALRQRGPARLVAAVPVAPPEACAAVRAEVDELVCVTTAQPFDAVGQWYADFSQTTDAQVRDLLARCTSAKP
ncbi:MAG TPA: phosphoribosyltransferase [Roseiflexaceae bacterium]|nr:phosphoribosyltransferase [Roseiflexaceae bacterium]